MQDKITEDTVAAPVFKRRKKKCPECRQWKVDLVNHMKRRHKWEKAKAAKVLQITNQRKVKEVKKRKVVRVKCTHCEARVFSLRSHMKQCHPKYITSTSVAPSCFYSSSANEPLEVQPTASTPMKNEEFNEVADILNNFIDDAEVEPMNIVDKESYIIPEDLASMIEEFRHWQQGPQGGGNKPVTALHNAEMMKRICRQLNVKTLACLLEDSSLWRMFYNKKQDGSWSGHTSRTYMVAMKKFMQFICKDVRRGRYSTNDERILAQSLHTDFSGWSKSFKRQIGEETAVKRIQQVQAMLTADKMKKYKASAEYRKAFILLSQCNQPDFIITSRVFTIVRNYLLFQLNWRNANRSGVLGEMTVEDYNSKKKYHCKDSGMTEYVITIIKHKTLAQAGPAKIALSSQLVTQMDLYRDHVRAQVVGLGTTVDCGYFFTTYNGKSIIESSLISHQISAHAKASGLGHMTSNDCRRSATTVTREVDPSMARDVAVHMNHSEATAMKVYDLASKDKACFRSAQFLEKCYSGELEPLSSVIGIYYMSNDFLILLYKI